MKKSVLSLSLLVLIVFTGTARAVSPDTVTAGPADVSRVSPKKKLLSYATIAKLEALFLKSLSLSGNLDANREVSLPVDYQVTIADQDQTDFGTRSYEVDIDIEQATFRNLTVDMDSDFSLHEETEKEYDFTKKTKICADRIVIKGTVDAHHYAFIRNDVPLPDDDPDIGFFDEYSFRAAGYSDARLTLEGTTCIPLDITIRIDRSTGRETYVHEIIPGYRINEAVEGATKTELVNPVFTEADFEGITIPLFLIPEDYAADAIAATLDEFLSGTLLKAIAEEIFVLDLPPALDLLLQNVH